MRRGTGGGNRRHELMTGPQVTECSSPRPLTRIYAGVVRSDGVRVKDGDVMLLGESEIPVHLLQELGRVQFVCLRVFPHVAEPNEFVGSRQEMILGCVLLRRSPMIHLT